MNTYLLINKFLHLFEIRRVKTRNKEVYLTFDDGPEPEITEFVLNELDKYYFKATFFSRGDNAEKNNELLNLIRQNGHSIGNHTFSHLHGFKSDCAKYISDVRKADKVLNTTLFRPPMGALTLLQFLKLCVSFKIVYWNLGSNDWTEERFDLVSSLDQLKRSTKPGSVVLFHFCKKHEKETKQILPLYCKWLNSNGWVSKAL